MLAWAVGNETADLRPEAGGGSSRIMTLKREEDRRWVLVSDQAQAIAE
jgi:cell wall assembly regulator SMI1